MATAANNNDGKVHSGPTADSLYAPTDHILLADGKKLNPNHLQDLRTSGLNDETIIDNGIYTENDTRSVKTLLNGGAYSSKNGSALVFPVVGLDGQRVFSRVKPDTPSVRGSRTLKYLTPKSQQPHAYYPRRMWESADNAESRLFVTEGEKKSLKLTQEGFLAIGLAGVEMWHKKGNVSLTPDLQRIVWKGRSVYIVFDSDLMEKDGVRVAMTGLAAALRQQHANVFIVYLPADGNEKVGADDYLIANGPADFEKLVGKAEPAPEPDEIFQKLPLSELPPETVAKQVWSSHFSQGGLSTIYFYQGEFYAWHRGRFRPVGKDEFRPTFVRKLQSDYVMIKPADVSGVIENFRAACLLASGSDTPRWINRPSEARTWAAEDCFVTRKNIIHLPSYGQGHDRIDNSPAFFGTAVSDCESTCTAPPIRWLEFLHQIFGGDRDSIALLQEWFGYCLTASKRHHKILFVLGPIRSGKGTIRYILERVVGAESCGVLTFSQLGERFGLQSLIRKTVGFMTDVRVTPQTSVDSLERILTISGDDPQFIDRKNLPPLENVRMKIRLMIFTNELPRVRDASGAFARRMMIVKTRESFLGREDHELKDKLAEELPQILHWAIEGRQRLEEQQMFTIPESTASDRRDLQHLSSPVTAFVEDCCELGDGHQITTSSLYTAFTAWCSREGKRMPTDKPTFMRDLLASTWTISVNRKMQAGVRTKVASGISLRSDVPGGNLA